MKESKEVDLEHHMRPMVADVHWFKVCFTMEMQPVMAKYLEGNQTEARYSTMFGIGFKEVVSSSHADVNVWEMFFCNIRFPITICA